MLAVTLLIVMGISTHYCHGHPYNQDQTIDSNIRVQPASIEEYEGEEWRVEKEEDKGREGIMRPNNNGGYGKAWGAWTGDRYNMAETNGEPIAHAAAPPVMRNPVPNRAPYTAIGRFTTAGCTGTFVARRAILTAAHCVYSKKQGFQPMGTFERKKDCNPNNGAAQYTVKSVHVTNTYQQFERTKDDYAIVITNQASPRNVPLAYDGKNTIKRMPLTVYGYPNNDPYECLHESTCPLSKNYPTFLNYQCKSISGMSGGPIINNGVIVGVHSSGDDGTGNKPVVYDTGVRIKGHVKTNIKKWITNNGGNQP